MCLSFVCEGPHSLLSYLLASVVIHSTVIIFSLLLQLLFVDLHFDLGFDSSNLWNFDQLGLFVHWFAVLRLSSPLFLLQIILFFSLFFFRLSMNVIFLTSLHYFGIMNSFVVVSLELVAIAIEDKSLGNLQNAFSNLPWETYFLAKNDRACW